MKNDDNLYEIRHEFAGENEDGKKCMKPCKMLTYSSTQCKKAQNQGKSEQSFMPKEISNFGYNNC